MIIGFGFGNPLISVLMLIGTGLLSFLLFRYIPRRHKNFTKPTRLELRQYYYDQRRKAHEFSMHFDLTDEEIERRIDIELGPKS